VDPPLAALGATVVLWGTLEEGQGGLGALARLDAPTVPHVGFAAGALGTRAFITGAGELLYTQQDSGDRERIRKFRQDSFAWDASASRWLYPVETAGNDPEVPTPACNGTTPLTSWVVQRGTGEVLYACGGTTYFDSTGATRLEGYTLHAWQSVSEMLVTTTDGTTTTWLVFDELTRNEFPLVDFAPAPGDTVVAVHTTVAGFYLLVQSAAGTLSLWQVGAFFPAVYLGEYPAVTGYTIAHLALDEDGALHVLATDDASPGREIVLRLTLLTPPLPATRAWSTQKRTRRRRRGGPRTRRASSCSRAVRERPGSSPPPERAAGAAAR
jgi:hypothetical protein